MPPQFLSSRVSNSSSSSSRSSAREQGQKRASKSHKKTDLRTIRIDIQPANQTTPVPAKQGIQRRYVFASILLLLLCFAFVSTRESWRAVERTENTDFQLTPAALQTSDVASVESLSKLDAKPVEDPALQIQEAAASSSTPPSSVANPNTCSLTASAAACDWSWGASGSANSLDHSREEADDFNMTSSRWKRPQDFYSYRVQLTTIEKQTGALVTIFMRDQCCSAASPFPSSYFRVTVVGTAQAASHTPITLGPPVPPAGLHPDNNFDWASLAETEINNADTNSKPDHERVIRTFLLLPDAGHYRLHVRLLHYNASLQMLSETFLEGNTRAYESKERGAIWVNGLLREAETGFNFSKLYVPSDSIFAEQLPLCGSIADEQLRAASVLARNSLPLAGRWLLRHSEASVPAARPEGFHTAGEDMTDQDPTWLVTNSIWAPHFCRVDYGASVAATFPALRWLHVMGDSNTKVFFRRFMCPLANGTTLETNPDKFPGKFDPPRLCMGPSTSTNEADGTTGAALASNPLWVATYSHWHHPKPTLLDTLEPDHLWGYRPQCYQFKQDYRKGALVRGWPQCLLAPQSIQSLPAPGVTYFAFGSHCAHLGDSEATRAFVDSDDMYGLVYFRFHAPMFPLTTAINPHIIPRDFARQQRMRNNERIAAVNQLIMNSVRKRRNSFAPQSSVDKNWLPVLDIFSPTHAAYEVLNGDAVHFIEFLYQQQMKWIAHMLAHAPNYQTNIH